MGAIETTFSGTAERVAIDLPAELGFAPGTLVRVEKIGGEVRITAVEQEIDAEQQKRKLIEALDKIKAIWGDTPPKTDPLERERLRIEFPDRPGLY